MAETLDVPDAPRIVLCLSCAGKACALHCFCCGTAIGLVSGGVRGGAIGAGAGYGIGALASPLANLGRTPDERVYITAQLAFIAGILRKESGAAITAEEYRQYGRIYFPQVGDDAATIAYKRDLRQAEIDALQEQFPNRPFRSAPALRQTRQAE